MRENLILFRSGFLFSILLSPTWSFALAAPDRIFIDDLSVEPGAKGFAVAVRADIAQVRHGFTIALRYDPAVLSPVTVEVDGKTKPRIDLAETVCAGAEWSEGSHDPSGTISWGVLMDIESPLARTIPAGSAQVLLNFYFDVVTTVPVRTMILPEDGAGSSPGNWSNLLLSKGGAPVQPELGGGRITIGDPGPEPNRFTRGDCNGDRALDISDAVSVLFSIFAGAPSPPCEEGCNANSDGATDVSDAVHVLSFLYQGGPAPKAPFPACDLAPVESCAAGTCASS